MNIEKEIEDSKNRIEEREKKIQIELSRLDSKIATFTNWAWGFVIIGLIIIIISSIYFAFMTYGKVFELNLLGDFMAGSVASIWSLAGLFFIYVAFLGQKQQLINQQLEIMYSQLEVKYTRLELAGQKKEMKLQNETLRTQKFENTFFQLINLFNDISNSMDITNYGKDYTGRDCFKELFEEFRRNTEQYKRGLNNGNKISPKEILEGYSIFYNNFLSDLSHYYRTIYHVLKFIDNSDIENKKQYTSLVRSQLSSYEQILIFYNCIHDNGKEKFKPLIEKYQIFKNIDDKLLFSKIHKKAYSDSAYRTL